MFAILLPDLPGFSVEQRERTEQGIRITARAPAASACCPDCQQASSRVQSYYTRRPMDLPVTRATDLVSSPGTPFSLFQSRLPRQDVCGTLAPPPPPPRATDVSLTREPPRARRRGRRASGSPQKPGGRGWRVVPRPSCACFVIVLCLPHCPSKS